LALRLRHTASYNQCDLSRSPATPETSSPWEGMTQGGGLQSDPERGSINRFKELGMIRNPPISRRLDSERETVDLLC